MKKIFLIFLLFFLQNVPAKTIPLDPKMDIIQIGAFHESKNISQFLNNFKNYNILVKDFPTGFKKVFIVNINPKTTQETLKKIKQIVPNAFLLNKTLKSNLLNTLNSQKTFIKKTSPKKQSLTNNLTHLNKNKDYFNYNILDSKAIIKTRKKFFE